MAEQYKEGYLTVSDVVPERLVRIVMVEFWGFNFLIKECFVSGINKNSYLYK